MNFANAGMSEYGAAEVPADAELPQYAFRKPRRTVGAGACLAGVLVPLTLFSTMFTVASYSIGYKYPGACRAAEFAGVGIALYFGYSAYLLKKKGGDPAWFGFLCITSFLAIVTAAEFGDQNLERNLRPFYDIASLNVYPHVDPATTTGSQVMDAGRFVFVPGSHVDITHSMGFKNGNVYCVAPIVSGNATPPATYDFWAVGLNCCSPHLPDFHCGEFSNPFASQGLRLMSEAQRSFYRLAVQQAEAAYGIPASHPIFLEWMQTPETELNAYRDDGYKMWVTFIASFGAFQTLATVAACTVLAQKTL